MIKVKNKFLGAFLAGVLSITSVSGVIIQSKDTKIVYAAESQALRDAKAKINHLTSSLKTNYLGIKNQGTWQLYISQARELIKKIPNSEKAKRDALTVEVNRDEALVNALARINQVEKSIQPKSEGGYGNHIGIKNAETWTGYLNLAKTDLEKIDKGIFRKQYDELRGRMSKVSLVVKDIEDKFQVEYNKVVKLYEGAKSSDDLNKANEALKEAEKLGTCDRSDKLENDIKQLINNHPDNDNKVITFPDKALEKLIRNEIGKLSGSIYKRDVEDITVLETYPFENNGIKDISGIENLTNLEKLSLEWCEINDISSLENLTNLKVLSLIGNEINDIRSLANLTRLESLNLIGNQISDISPLEKLTNLKGVALGYTLRPNSSGIYFNKISDISPLRNLTNLEELDLSLNKISDISPLENLINLQYLDLEGNKINDVSVLENLIGLANLKLSNNEIYNISPLKSLTNLEDLYLWKNKINDLSPLKNLINLKILDLTENRVVDISPLYKLTNLISLNLNQNEINDISPFKNLTTLERLYLDENKINDITVLKNLYHLEEVCLNSNEINNISPLNGLVSLKLLFLKNNHVNDVKPLKGLYNLSGLDLTNNKVSNIDIQELKNHLTNCEVFY